ncbi:CdaR family protein [Alkalibacillus salilacus]|uniref:YbbR domain-containing protein n=1 Tax=Alkalibacillus salilacus TaxID=284582 RepID=A0ABT9VEV1_9BACI|nr:CdaR family protein [Alkalibacillus salilacus]MDQ0159491.1 YbbR domain-containing protein [Alkalibacillus salilacus]
MDNWLKSPWVTRIVSLFLAILLYTTVAIDDANTSRSSDTFLPSGSTVTQTMEEVPLQVDLEQDDEYVVRGVPDTVDVTVEGPRSVITQTVRQQNFDVLVDLNNLGEGEHQVDVTHDGISSQLSVLVDPNQVNVTIENRATETFPIEVDLVGDDSLDPNDVFASEPQLSPGEVEITGSTTEIDEVSMVKAIVSLPELAQSGEVSGAPVRVYDSEGNELNVYVDPSSVDITADVSVTDKRYPVTHETTGELDEDLVLQDISLNPSSATLYGSIDRLDEINQLEPVNIDLSEVSESTTIEVDLSTPSDVNRIEPETVEAEIEVEEAVEDTIEDVELEVENLAEDREITFIEPNDEPILDVQLTGTEETLSNLTREDIRVWIDVEGQVEGEFYADVQFEGPNGVTLSSDQERVRVRVE